MAFVYADAPRRGSLVDGVMTSGSAERCLRVMAPKVIAIDEFVRMAAAWLALLYLAGYVVAAFGLLCILDILKPIGVLECLPGGVLCSMTLQRPCSHISFGEVSLTS
jgi:hypothetical protein